MAIRTLDLPVTLPTENSACERCVADLRGRLASVRGVELVTVDPTKNTLTMKLDPARASLAQVERIARQTGVEIGKRFRHEMLELQGLDCADCAQVIEHAVGRLPGILDVSVNYAASRIWIEYDRDLVTRHDILRRIQALGYRIASGGDVGAGHRRELLFALTAGAFAGIGWLTGALNAPLPVVLGGFVASYIAGGWFPLRGTLRALRTRRVDIDVLMVVAALGAASIDRWAEGAVLLFLFSLGHALEHYAMDRARRAIRAIVQLAPRQATIKRAGQEVLVAIGDVTVGEIMVVKPGERIALDGEVTAGRSTVNQAAITGESMPVAKAPGATVFAGTINLDGAMEVRVTRLAQETTLAKIAKMVQEAQSQKSPTQRFTGRVAGYLVPSVLLAVCVVLVVLPALGVPFRDAFYRAMMLLVAASPCALAIATPAAVLSAIGRAAMSGVLVKGGTYLEEAGTVRVVALDKTGTLTQGTPTVTDVIPRGVSDEALLGIAAAVELRSEHPLAAAIVDAARTRAAVNEAAQEVRSVPGKGITGVVDGADVAVGTLEFLEDLKVPVDPEVKSEVARLQTDGKTAVLVVRALELIGIIGLADMPRSTAREALRRLKQVGIHTLVMLTGDNTRAAAMVASSLGVDEVRADLLPEEKVDAIRALVSQHRKVAMVGDGVNDGPALAAATVGIAMGASGTDVALETADIALMADDLNKLPYIIGLSRAARRIIWQNLGLSLGIIVVLVLTTVVGAMTLPIAVFLHEGSTLLVVMNGLRLLTYRGADVA